MPAGEGENLRKVEQILNDLLYREYLAKNAHYEGERRFCRHDLSHMLDVARIAYMLFLEAGEIGRLDEVHGLSGKEAAKELIYAAGLVHDIARWRQYETGEDHAQTGAELAVPLLSRAGFGHGEIEAIAAAVREHRSGGTKCTLLGDRLCRADDFSRPCFQCKVRGECYKFGKNGLNGALVY